jgi:glycosyltransferase involved in cell wall biosynthesis
MNSFDRNMRVAQLVKGLDIGGLHGGADVFGVNLSCALRKLGVDVRIIVFNKMNTRNEQRYVEQLDRCGVPIVFFEALEEKHRLRSYLRGMIKLNQYLRREKINILHSHFHVGSMMAAWFRLTRCVERTARTIHVDREWLRGWDSPVQQFLIRLFIFVLFPLLIDIESGVSSEAVNVLNTRWLALAINKKATIIYNGVPSPDYPVVVNWIRNGGEQKTPGKFVVGTIGRMTEQKGYEYLLRAVPEVLSIITQVEFWFIGDGPLRSDLENISINLGIQKHVLFLGIREDIANLFRKMDLFILPSIYEGLPTVVLESMANGVPVIATDVPGTREIIHDGVNGRLVPSRCPQDLAKAILQMLREPAERARLAEAGLLSVEKFTIERAAEKYRLLYSRKSA